MGEPSSPDAHVTVMAFGQTDPGRVRTNNEDAFLIAPLASASASAEPFKALTFDATSEGVLLAVSDGMGGADAGEVASALVIESLRRAMMEAEAQGAPWDEATTQAVKSANREVWSAAREPGKKGMGATLTAVCVRGGQAFIAEVGDSRAYLLRGGRIRQMTHDQSFIQLMIDTGALKPEQAEKFPMKNVVLQAMGQKPDVEVALGRLELRRGDQLLLCSDGLSNKLSADDMREVAERAPTLAAACNEMIDLANSRGGDDNVTVVLCRLDGEGLTLPMPTESMTTTFEVLAEYRAEAAAAGLVEPEEEDEGPALLRPLSADDLPGKPLKADPRPEPSDGKGEEKRVPTLPPAKPLAAAPGPAGPPWGLIAAVVLALLVVAYLALGR